MKYVVDTNVAVAANGKCDHANMACQLACIDFLQSVTTTISHKIVVDNLGLIFEEYKKRFSFKGQPGVGDSFFKFLYDHMYSGRKVELAQVTPIDDMARGFKELPINDFDASDRKFLATAVSAGAQIANAVDTDWNCKHELVASVGVRVRQLCPDHGCDPTKC